MLVRKLTGASVVLLAVLLAAVWPARADPRTETAREHSQQGDAYYKLEKYANAIAEYEQAYLAKPDPSFLYNIAQCHRLMGHGGEALKFYRRFLKDAPTAPNRPVAEKHIKDLEDEAAHQPATAVEPPAAAPAAAAPGLVPATPIAPPPASLSPASSPPSSEPPSPSQTALALSPPPPTSSPAVEAPPINENANAIPPTQAHPFYTRWWFWTAVGVVVLGGVLVAAAAKHDPSCPEGYQCN
jgi:tetratricopeptide (TPR) repeat protein